MVKNEKIPINGILYVICGWERVYNHEFGCRIWFWIAKMRSDGSIGVLCCKFAKLAKILKMWKIAIEGQTDASGAWKSVYNPYFGCRIWFCVRKCAPTRRLGSYAVNLRNWPKSLKSGILLYLAHLTRLMRPKVYMAIILDAEFDFARKNILRRVDYSAYTENLVKMAKIRKMWKIGISDTFYAWCV